MTNSILTLNGGSSSIKFAAFAPGAQPSRIFSGLVDRIGTADATLTVNETEGRPSERTSFQAVNPRQAAQRLVSWLDERLGRNAITAVGHRIVHGGPRYLESTRVTPELVAELRRLTSIDPAHLPGEIDLIESLSAWRGDVPQVACFDTAFHRHLPPVARLLPIPRRYAAAGVHRYGFHGLSYAYLLEELARVAGPAAARGRVILAHLGAGASMAAVREGVSIDTTMSFTPTAGLVMARRSGDLDPGVLIYLMRQEGLSADAIDALVNEQSGLLGISQLSADMRELLAVATTNPQAADAVELFCYQARKWIGALSAALGGLDTLVFAGGIGENSPPIRARICAELGHLGVQLDAAHNAGGAAILSSAASAATVRLIRTDEEVMIAKEVARLLSR